MFHVRFSLTFLNLPSNVVAWISPRTRPTRRNDRCSSSGPLRRRNAPSSFLAFPLTITVVLISCFAECRLQYWMLSKVGEIRRDESCLDYAGGDVVLYPCHGSKGNQYWIYNPNVSTSRYTFFFFRDYRAFRVGPAKALKNARTAFQNLFSGHPRKIARDRVSQVSRGSNRNYRYFA